MVNNTLPLFTFWCQKIIPLVYDNSLSYMELLCKVVDYLNNVIRQVDENKIQISVNTEEIKKLKQEISFIEDEIKKIKNGDYVSIYINALSSWIDKNLKELVGRVVKYVFFGLTDDGYFVAYIPDTWDFITFDTILDQNSPMFGHLILQW